MEGDQERKSLKSGVVCGIWRNGRHCAFTGTSPDSASSTGLDEGSHRLVTYRFYRCAVIEMSETRQDAKGRQNVGASVPLVRCVERCLPASCSRSNFAAAAPAARPWTDGAVVPAPFRPIPTTLPGPEAPDRVPELPLKRSPAPPLTVRWQFARGRFPGSEARRHSRGRWRCGYGGRPPARQFVGSNPTQPSGGRKASTQAWVASTTDRS